MSANSNVKPSTIFPPLAIGAPISVAAAGTLKTGWVDASTAHWLYLLASAGVIDGTAVVTWEQSQNADGSSPKALDAGSFATTANGGTACPSFAATDDGKVKSGVGKITDLDVNGGYRYVQATLTVTGGTGSLFALALLAGPAAYE